MKLKIIGKAFKLKIPVFFTDLRFGFVDTGMWKGEGSFCVTLVNEAVRWVFGWLKKGNCL